MAEPLHNRPIREWNDGDTVRGFAFLTRLEQRVDRNANRYFDLELSDASGRITAKIWPDSPAQSDDFEARRFVAFEGVVQRYKEERQLSLRRCRLATEADRDAGFDESLLVAASPYDLDELWRRLETVYPARIERPALRQLTARALELHGARLSRHPAAKTIHHAYLGGLLEHVVSMAELALAVCDHYAELDRDLVLVGVLFHDLGKLDELGEMPDNDYTPVGRLVGHVALGRDMLRELAAEVGLDPELRLALEHLVLSHQGRREWGSPVEPMIGEALALHFIDDLDSKLAQLRQLRRDGGGGFHFLRSFGRYVFVEEDAEQGTPSPDEDGSD